RGWGLPRRGRLAGGVLGDQAGVGGVRRVAPPPAVGGQRRRTVPGEGQPMTEYTIHVEPRRDCYQLHPGPVAALTFAVTIRVPGVPPRPDSPSLPPPPPALPFDLPPGEVTVNEFVAWLGALITDQGCTVQGFALQQ